MTWTMWRQHRTEVLALTVFVGIIAVALFVLGRPMHALFPTGPTHCLVPPLDQGCRSALAQLQQDYGYSTTVLILLNFAPYTIGGFIGAPLLARELEAGTWQLAWTQAVPRRRWLTVKILALGTVSILLAAGLSAVVAWYRQPLDLLGGFDITGFDLTGVVPVAYTLFAFALGVAAGAVLRRSLPAAAVAFVAFLAVRFTIAGWIRPHFLTPVTRVQAFVPGVGDITDGTTSVRDMILDQGFIDANGRHITGLDAVIMEGKAREGGGDPTIYLHEHGVQRWAVYQPIERYWTFQAIETATFVALAMLLLALVFWRIRRPTF
ncbi:transporter [Micromonospora ureilytica]|uniref:Transporter n=1 Tax=Micromonospora ureilytica TaxID=709868 RepID=A0A3N9Y5D2_9ACTN|nr:ABC transporter permease subunit [Micromonospora ureilytica]RQX20449.1 transporter [Micromonospora ureilytica]